MKKILKSILSVFIAVVMTLGSAPLSGFVGLEMPQTKDIGKGFGKFAASVSELLDSFVLKANAETWDVYTYSVDAANNTATITKCDTSAAGDLVIPATLGGYNVVSIASNAFENCTEIVSVVLPEHISTIGSNAFMGCLALESVVLPDEADFVDYKAFSGCVNLKEFDFGGTDRVSYGIFSGCTSLKTLTIPSFDEVTLSSGLSKNGPLYGSSVEVLVLEEGSTRIPSYLAFGCSSLQKVVLPDSLTSIGNYAFKNCSNLASIDLNKVETLGYYVFEGCTSITEITIPKTLTTVYSNSKMKGPFAGSSITKVVFEEGITDIPAYVCAGGTTIKDVVLPKSVKSIGDYAFSECSGIKTLLLPKNVVSMGNYAFNLCTSLFFVDLNNVSEIGYYAFNGCTSLLSIVLPNTLTNSSASDNYGPLAGSSIIKVEFEEGTQNIPAYTCAGASSLTSVKMPDSVVSIEDYAFYGCSVLASLPLSLALVSAGDYAFAECSALTEVTFSESFSQLSDTAFDGTTVFVNIFEEDSPVTLTLIDNAIPFSSTKNGINDADDLFLDREKSAYSTVISTTSASGVIPMLIKYDFEESVKSDVTYRKLTVRIPSDVTFDVDNVQISGKVSSCVYENNLLTIVLNDNSGTVSFYVEAKETAEYLLSYAKMEYVANKTLMSETIGIVNMASELLTLHVPDETVDENVFIHGITSPGETVTVYIDGVSAGTCVSSKVGIYSKSLVLPEPLPGNEYVIDVKITRDDGSIKSVSDTVRINDGTAVMTSCKMYYRSNEYDMMNQTGKSPIISWASGSSFTFKISFSNNDMIESVYVVSTKNGQKERIRAVFNEEKNEFVANGFKGVVPGTISIEYESKHKEFIVDVNEEFDFQEEYDNLPEILKEAEVELVENTFESSDSDTGRLEANIKTTDGSGIDVNYSVERFDSTQISASEDVLKKSGFDRIEKNDGTVSYMKVTENGNKSTMETYDFIVDSGTLIGGTLVDIIISLLPDGNFEPIDTTGNIGVFSGLVGMATDTIEIAGYQYENAQIADKIRSLDISEAEKQARLESLNDIANTRNTLKVLKQFSSIVAIGMGIAVGALSGPAICLASVIAVGIGVANNCAWFILENYMGNLYDDRTQNLLNVSYRYAIDPSGYVYEAVTGNRLANVKATAYFKSSSSATAVVWDASEYDQVNPLYTDSGGCFAWDVPEGLWQVKFEKDGYETAYSEWLPVPPPQLDVNVSMNSLSAPEVSYINAYENGVEIGFTQYMNIDSVNSENIAVTCNGAVVSGEFAPIDAGMNYEETAEYAKTFMFTADSVLNGEVTVSISDVENYCSTKIAALYEQTYAVGLEITSVSVPETDSVDYLSSKSITVQAYPAEAARGKTVNVTLSDSQIVSAESLTLTFDENGIATLHLSTLLPGEVDITFSVENTSLTATTALTVELDVPVAVSSVAIDSYDETLNIGETKQLTAAVIPSDADNQSVIWSSNDESVATVTSDGLITAISKGKAVISATTVDGNFIAACDVTVIILPSEVTLDYYEIEFNVGSSLQNIATVTPENSDYIIDWTSADSDIATVDENGLITGVSLGETQIIASVNDDYLTAVCNVKVVPRSFTVTWDIDGVKTEQSFNEGAPIVLPDTPNKVGYSFAEWTPSVPDYMPSENVTFTATWDANTYDALFDANGGKWADGDEEKTVPTDFDAKIAVPELPEKQGYIFSGWEIGGENVGTDIGVMDNINGKEFTAVWVAATDTVYTVETYTMNTEGDYEKSIQIMNGTTDETANVAPDIETGFSLNAEMSVLSGIIAADNTLVLKVYIDRNTYRFTTVVDEVETKTDYLYGSILAEPATPVKTGYEFDGWDSEIPETMPAEDLKITATWNANSYDATFDANGGKWTDGSSQKIVSVKFDSEIIYPEAPEKQGYVFSGWALGDKNLGTNLGVMDDVKGKMFTAVWVSSTDTVYTVETYTMNVEGEYEKSTQTLRGTTDDIASVTLDVENGLTINTEKSVLSGTIAADNSLVLTVYIDRNTYVFETVIDGVSNKINHRYGAKLQIPEVPQKTGYTFAGWTPQIPKTMPAEDLTFTATWTANSYDAVFVANGGKWSDGAAAKTVSTEFDAEIKAPEAPSRQGYIFLKWSSEVGVMDDVNGKKFVAEWITSTDTNYTVETYTMNTSGKYVKSSKTLTGTTGDTVSTNPAVSAGFSLNNSKSVLSGTVAADNSLVLKVYIDRNTYTFTTVVDGVSTSAEYLYGSLVADPVTPVKSGYKFIKWDKAIPETMPAKNVKVTAVFETVYTCPDCGDEIAGEEAIAEHIAAEARMKSTVSIKNNPGSKTINYGETLRLTATASKPDEAIICWYIDGIKKGEGEKFDVTFESGTKTVEVKLVDVDGNVLKCVNGDEISDSESVTVKSGFFQKIISFFKNLFRMDRTVIQ